MSYKSIFSKKGFLFIYFAMWSSLIITAAIWLTVFLVGTLRNPARITEPENTEVFDSILALTDKKVVRYLGEWEFLEPEQTAARR